jgi:hypothetical protein
MGELKIGDHVVLRRDADDAEGNVMVRAATEGVVEETIDEGGISVRFANGSLVTVPDAGLERVGQDGELFLF